MESAQPPEKTLGEVLYSSSSQRLVSEKNWVGLARSLEQGDAAALHALYERTHRPVFTLILRLTGSRETAEELTLDLFDDLWRGSVRYDAIGTVLGWVMNQARSRAIDWLRLEQQQTASAPDEREIMKLNEQTRQLRTALNALAPEERAALEIAFLSELTYFEVAARLKQTPGSTKARLRSALHKLRRAPLEPNRCAQSELVCALAIGALPAFEAAGVATHLGSCPQCSVEWESLRPVVDSFVAWPTDVLRPSASLRERLARIAPSDAAAPQPRWSAPEWEHVAPGIFCRLLATDTEKHVVSMLVRLVPGGKYPAHRHAGTEELHLLEGELWIDERKLHAGDYNRAEPGTSDSRVWSETGCTCVLMTSTNDVLRSRTMTDSTESEDARVLAEKARAIAEQARVERETARDSAEKLRAIAESIREQFELLRRSAEQARVFSEQARTAAETARDAAELARRSADRAEQSAENAQASADAARDAAKRA